MAHLIAGTYDDDIADLDATMRNLPYKYGFSPKAYKVITDVTIPKKEDVPDVELNRTIMKFNAAFNMNLKKLGRDTLAHGEEAKQLADEMFGSRKGMKAANAALNKELYFNILHQKHLPGSLLSNDARQCYDRISHNVVGLAMRRLGAPKEAVNSMLETLQDADHYVQTGYGRSATTYGGKKRAAKNEPPMQGKGQGSGDGPASFLALVLPMIEEMLMLAFGAFIIASISLTILHILSIMFVDDADNLTTGADVYATAESVIEKTQASADNWHGLIRAGGGELAPEKSFWYMIDFEFQASSCQWKFPRKEDLPGEITFSDSEGNRIPLARYDHDEAQKTLGIHLAPDGNMREQIKYLRGKAEDYASKIRLGAIDRNTSWQAMQTTIMKTISYPMPATTITEKEWDKIMAPILGATLPKSGIARNFPRDLVYGPSEYQGLDLMHPWHQQELTHMQTFLDECVNPDSVTRALLLISVEAMKLETGLEGKLFKQPHHLTKDYTTPCWIKNMWKSMLEFDIYFEEPTPNLPLKRIGDSFLMQNFIEHGYKGKDLRILNCCRMQLQAITVADIADAAGLYITDSAIAGTSCTPWHSYDWPRNPPQIPRAYWNLWKKALKESLCNNSEVYKLTTTLQQAVTSPTTPWTWHVSTDHTQLFQETPQGYKEYLTTRTTPRHSTNFAASDTILPALPPNTTFASASVITDATVKFTGTFNLQHTTTDHTQNTEHLDEVDEITNMVHHQDRWAVQEIIQAGDTAPIAIDIINGKARQISDGSYKEGRGTSAFMVTTKDHTSKIIGVNSVPGEEGDQSSYRSELAGIAGGVVVIDAICRKHNIQEGHITAGLDGDQALKAAFGPWEPKPSDPDYDLITDIRAHIARLPITTRGHWVQGHQDSKRDRLMLDQWALDNIKMDSLAKAHWRKQTERLEPIIFRDEAMIMKFQGDKLSHFNKRYIYNHLKAIPTFEYWEKRHELQRHITVAIDWESCGKAYRGLPLSKQRRVTKHASGHCGTGHTLMLRGYQNHSNCPICDHEDEDTQHVLKCPSRKATTQWNLEIKKLQAWMIERETEPILQNIIIQGIDGCRNSTQLQHPRLSNAQRLAVAEQNAIGWYQFLLGRMTYLFAELQETHYKKSGSKKSAQKWAVDLIRQVWKITWGMWEHRNDILHTKMTPQKQRILADLRDQVIEQFQLGTDGLLAADRPKLSNQERIMQFDIPDMKRWLTSMELARDTQAQIEARNTRELQAQQTLMRNHFRLGETATGDTDE